MCSNCLSLRADSYEPMMISPCGHRICVSCLLRVSGPRFLCRYPFCGRLIEAPIVKEAKLTCRQVFEQVVAQVNLGVCKGFGLPRSVICLSDKCVKKGMAECVECLKVSHANCPADSMVSYPEIIRQMYLEVPDLVTLLRVFNEELMELALPESNGQLLSKKLKGLVERFLTTEPQHFLISGSGYRMHRVDGMVLVSDPLLTELEQFVLDMHTRPQMTEDGVSESLDEVNIRSRRIMELIMDLLGEKLVEEEHHEKSELVDWRSGRGSYLDSEVSRDSTEVINLRREKSKKQQDYVQLVESTSDRPAEVMTNSFQPDLMDERLPLRQTTQVPDEVEAAVRLIESNVLASIAPIELPSQVRTSKEEDQVPSKTLEDRIKVLEDALEEQEERRGCRLLGRRKCIGRKRKFKRLLGVSLLAIVLVMSLCMMEGGSTHPTDDPSVKESIELMVKLEMDRQQHLIEMKVASQVLTQIEYKIDAFKTEIRNEMEKKHAYLNVLDQTLEGAVAKLAEMNQVKECPSADAATNSGRIEAENEMVTPVASEQTLGHLVMKVVKFFKGKRDLREPLTNSTSANNTTDTSSSSTLSQGSLGKLFSLLDPLLNAKFDQVREDIMTEVRATASLSTPSSSLSAEQLIVQETFADNLLHTDFASLRRSTIMTGEQRRYLAILLSERFTSATLLLNSAKDGGSPEVFHQRCDNKGPTLVLVKSGTYIGGGVTDASWTSSNTVKESPNAYVFSLNRRQVYRVTEFGQHKAVRDNVLKGPCFTDALEIGPDFKSGRNWSELCTTYGQKCLGKSKASLFGENTFAIDQYEVYQLA